MNKKGFENLHKKDVKIETKEKISLKILILDDQADNFRWRFADQENVTLAKSVSEAEQYLKAGEFDVLFLDGLLDENDVVNTGPDALSYWAERKINLPPVFMISSSKEMQQKGIEAGAKGAIDKALAFSGDMEAIEKAVKSL